MSDDEDVSSNPKADGHLPVAGEFDAENAPQENSLTTDKFDDDVEDPNDINELSAKRTDEIEEAPNPDGPADPAATSGEGQP